MFINASEVHSVCSSFDRLYRNEVTIMLSPSGLMNLDYLKETAWFV